MCHVDRIWHIFFCFVRSITELDTLISCSDRIDLVFSHFRFQCFIYTKGNICGLFVQSCDHCTGICIKSEFTTIISDLTNSISYDLLDINVCCCCNFTHYKYKTCCCSCFACNTSHRVLFHNCIKNGIRNGITHFVRMAFGYRFRSE